MSDVDIQITGLNELIAAFGREDISQVVTDLLAQAGADIVDEVRGTNAFQDRTGRLRAGFQVLSFGDMTVTIGSDVFYDPFLERGTSRMTAREHWRPALDRLIPQIRIDLQTAITEMLR